MILPRHILPAWFSPGRRPRWLRRAAKCGAAAAVAILLAWAAFWIAVYCWPYPRGLEIPPAAGTFLEDRHGVPLAAFVANDDQWQLPLAADEVSPHLVHAVIAAEDRRFYDHTGVDWQAVAAAALQDVRACRIVRGASTLTMQLERLRDPQPRSWAGKLLQAVRACQIERGAAGAGRLTKDAILLEYLNRAPFGGNLIGAGAASWRYFGKPCRELSLGQAALLAGLPQSPNRFRPDRFPDRAAARRDFVLDRMVACGFITPAQSAEARREPLDAAWRPLPQTRTPVGPGQPAADGALPTLAWLGQLRAGAITRLTLDTRLQQQACTAARDQLRALAPSGITSAAVVILDTPTAEVRAAVSLGDDTPDLDLTRSPRSSGSTLKPFIYAVAFDSGEITPASILDDSPHAWAGYVPSNFDRDFMGPLSAAEALADSRNIPAMVVLARTGLPRAVGLMNAAGLRSIADGGDPARYGLSLAIGGADVTPLELAEAYATLARGGIHRPATFLPPAHDTRSATAADGAESETLEDERRVLPAWACWQTLHALALDARTARLCPDAVRTHVAWKTGTSSGLRDAWCAAVTPAHTVVVWVGRAQGGPGASALTGTEAAAPLALNLIASLDAPHSPGEAAPDWPRKPAPINPPPPPPSPPPRPPPRRPPSSPPPHASPSSPPPPAAKSSSSPRSIPTASGSPCNPPAAPAPAGGSWTTRPPAPAQAWWSPTPGTHEIRVVDAAGHAAAVTIRVR